MAVRRIFQLGNPVLWKKATPVQTIGRAEQKLIEDLFDTMEANEGVGLAAPQIGVLKRVFVARWEGQEFVFINPILEPIGDERVSGLEGCLSIPGVSGLVWRPEKVRVRGRDRLGKPQVVEASGWLARIFSHENDHLDGVLITETAEKLYWAVLEKTSEGEETTRLIPTTKDEILATFRKRKKPATVR